MTRVTVYSTGPSCQRCRLTCTRLDELGIRYDLVDIHAEHNAALRAFLVDELGYREAPVVEAGDVRWSGFRPDLIDAIVLRIATPRPPGLSEQGPVQYQTPRRPIGQ